MSKEELIEFLKKNGYEAKVESGIVYVNTPVSNHKEISKLISSTGYRGSYGTKFEPSSTDGKDGV